MFDTRKTPCCTALKYIPTPDTEDTYNLPLTLLREEMIMAGRVKTLFLTVLLLVSAVQGAFAQDTLSVATVTAAPGDANVTVQISADTSQPLTALTFDLTFSLSLIHI